MAGRPRIGLSRVALALALVAVVAIAGVAVYLTQVLPGQTPTPSPSLAMSPALPLIAPGQIQNYSSIELSTVDGLKASGTLTLAAFAPSGISLVLSQTSVSFADNPQSIPVQLKADPGVLPGKYIVTIEARSSGIKPLNTTFAIDVVPALVVMQAAAFHPQNITVSKGTQVTWLNLDSTLGCCDPGDHDVSFLSGANATSPVLSRFESWNYTFGADGIVNYYCTIHPLTMKGKVTVVG